MANQVDHTGPHRVLDHEGFPGRWEILETADETGGERFKTRIELDEQGELPPHLHPTAEESYEVVDGELEVQAEQAEWGLTSRRFTRPWVLQRISGDALCQ